MFSYSKAMFFCSLITLTLLLSTVACSPPPQQSQLSSDEEQVNNFDYEPKDVKVPDESIFYRPVSHDLQFENELEKRSYPHIINNWKRAWVDKFWSTVRKKGLSKRRLSAGEILEILRQMSEGKGISQGRLKAVRFGISRKRSEPFDNEWSSNDVYE